MSISTLFASTKAFAIRKGSQAKLWGIRNGPTIGLVVGLASLGYTVYSACKATMRLEETMALHCNEIQKVKDTYNDREEVIAMGLTEKDRRHDIFVVYTRTVIDLAKLYGPSIIAGGIGITSIICAHNTQNRRIQSLAAAYSALQGVFDRYRRVVRARYGEQADFYGMNGMIADTDDTVTIKNEDGTEEERQVYKIDTNTVFDGYSCIFDATTGEFERHDPDYNIAYLIARQSEANSMLDMRGHLFLNEVYDLIYGPGESYYDPETGEKKERRTLAGQYVGWIKDGNGDGKVNFRIKVLHAEPFDDGKPFEAPPILIDPNVDGVIMDCLVPKNKRVKADFAVDEAIDKWKNNAETE